MELDNVGMVSDGTQELCFQDHVDGTRPSILARAFEELRLQALAQSFEDVSFAMVLLVFGP